MRSKIWEILGLAALMMFFITGCAFLDSFFGVTPTGERVSAASSPAAAAGGILSIWFPWATTVLGAAGSVYAAIRGNSWKTAATTTISGIEEFLATPDGAAIKAKLVEKLSGKHEEANITALVDKVLESIKS